MSQLEETFAFHLKAAGLPTPEREVRFDSSRRWRFDFAWPAQLIALEVEGGTRSGGRHNRPRGFEADCEKYNAAAMQGWTVLRVTGAMVRDGRALRTAEQALSGAQQGRSVNVDGRLTK